VMPTLVNKTYPPPPTDHSQRYLQARAGVVHPIDDDLEGPILGAPDDLPCYVADRTGHTDYVSAHEVGYRLHERKF